MWNRQKQFCEFPANPIAIFPIAGRVINLINCKLTKTCRPLTAPSPFDDLTKKKHGNSQVPQKHLQCEKLLGCWPH